MQTLVVIVVMVIFVYAITKVTDKRMRARGKGTPAPEWARVLFILVVVGFLHCLSGAGPHRRHALVMSIMATT